MYRIKYDWCAIFVLDNLTLDNIKIFSFKYHKLVFELSQNLFKICLKLPVLLKDNFIDSKILGLVLNDQTSI